MIHCIMIVHFCKLNSCTTVTIYPFSKTPRGIGLCKSYLIFDRNTESKLSTISLSKLFPGIEK